MFDDETVSLACPSCGHKNPILIRDAESAALTTFVCGGCRKILKIDLEGFHRHLDHVRAELDKIQNDAAAAKKRQGPGSSDDYQI